MLLIRHWEIKIISDGNEIEQVNIKKWVYSI